MHLAWAVNIRISISVVVINLIVFTVLNFANALLL